jgi:hypothetical protein
VNSSLVFFFCTKLYPLILLRVNYDLFPSCLCQHEIQKPSNKKINVSTLDPHSNFASFYQIVQNWSIPLTPSPHSDVDQEQLEMLEDFTHSKSWLSSFFIRIPICSLRIMIGWANAVSITFSHHRDAVSKTEILYTPNYVTKVCMCVFSKKGFRGKD